MIRIHPTGFSEWVEEDRPVVTATFGFGNTRDLEVHLEWTDQGELLAQGWFRVADLQAVINTAVNNFQKGTP